MIKAWFFGLMFVICPTNAVIRQHSKGLKVLNRIFDTQNSVLNPFFGLKNRINIGLSISYTDPNPVYQFTSLTRFLTNPAI